MSGSLEEIRNWKLEAKFEDTEKYFYEFSAVDRLTSGDKFFVVGRKGTGKTAISEYLRKINKYDVFAEKLTFKNFPFNELYLRRDDKFILPNQYITLWKYLIYSFVCKLMAKNVQIDRAVSDGMTLKLNWNGARNIYRASCRFAFRGLQIQLARFCHFVLRGVPRFPTPKLGMDFSKKVA